MVTCAPRKPVFAVLDTWNILHGAQSTAANYTWMPGTQSKTRVHALYLKRLVELDGLLSGYAALATKNCPDALLKNWSDWGRMRCQEVGWRSGREQGIDEMLQNQIRSYADRYRYPENGVVALLTGDGAGYENGDGFIPALEQVMRSGHKVEVYSWRCCVNRALRDWAVTHGRFVELDQYFHAITFEEGGRRVESWRYTNEAKERARWRSSTSG